MTCREVIGFLMDYVDGLLPVKVRGEFEKHLSVCDSCVAYLRTYELSIRMEKAAAIEEVPVPEDLVKAIVASRGM